MFRVSPGPLVVLLPLLLLTNAHADSQDAYTLAIKAVSPDARIASQAIQSLRQMGPHGLQILLATHRDLLQRSLELTPQVRSGHPKWKRLKYALDKTGAQCDNWAARLYWYTDFAKAKAAAAAQNKPILSLRLLGKLDDELSCANSRFFRTALYPNGEINHLLKSSFILHWQSVRPVPKVTIDFGNGRKIQTTVTGNSVHYILDSKGRVVDALPGLYSPHAFYGWLESSSYTAREAASRTNQARNDWIKTLHSAWLRNNTTRWQAEIASLHQEFPVLLPRDASVSITPATAQSTKASPAQAPPHLEAAAMSDEDDYVDSQVRVTAASANYRAPVKALIETRLILNVTMPLPRDRDALRRTTTNDVWARLAKLHARDSILDTPSIEVLTAKSLNPRAALKTFQMLIAEDTLRNEYLRHAVIYQWLSENPAMTLDELNKKVYAEIFLAPDSDPWMVLLQADRYTALPYNGVALKQSGPAH